MENEGELCFWRHQEHPVLGDLCPQEIYLPMLQATENLTKYALTENTSIHESILQIVLKTTQSQSRLRSRCMI